jgi:predicted RNA-binding Zn ribbon-like protein
MVDLLAFPLVGGRSALNFVGTLGKRGTEDLERLRTPDDLTVWAELSGMGAIAAGASDLEAARSLREAIYNLLTATISTEDGLPIAGGAGQRAALSPAGVAIVNDWAAGPTPAVALAVDSGGLLRNDPVTTASAVLAAVARDAIDLLTGPEARSIRECEDPTCTLLFVDSSRSHRRRWCSMDRCGARSKMRTLRSAQ